MKKHAITDTIMYHTVRSDDLDVLKAFVAGQVAEGYSATELYRSGENAGEVTLWHSIAADLGRIEIETRCDAAGITYRYVKTEHILHENEIHDKQGAIHPSAILDGTLYVPVQDKETKENDRLLVMFPDQCNHGVTICTECAGSWDIDFEVRYSDTEAGRELAGQRPAAAP